MVFQNPYHSLNPKMKIYDILKESLDINTKLSRSEKKERIEQIIKDVGLPVEALENYPHEFSGGQRQRIAIARALILKPQILIADEPVSALDASIQAQILNLLNDLKKKYNLTIIFISHDLRVIKYLADRVAVMSLGEIKEIGTVEFKNVSFKYPDAKEYLLKNISFKANQGETVAFIGSTGSGKSTLINLVPRFYDATEGTVLVDGIDVKEYTGELLHNKIGYIPQKAVMFNGTISSNVAYGDNGKEELTEEQIKKAIEVAQGKDFVEKMDDKYNSHIASGGTNISGGQKQRLAIARAIARDPEIYIFDDSFSALDYKTDAALRKALKKHTKNATSLIVAQRIGTIMNADKIIVLDNGKCVGMGTHKELLKKCKVYKQIALSQLSKEELENE